MRSATPMPSLRASTEYGMEFDNFVEDYEDQVAHALGARRVSQSILLDAKVREIEWIADRLSPTHRVQSVLDLGCGVGSITRRVARADRRVTGVDVAFAPLLRARREVAAARFVRFDGRRLPFQTGCFDLVVAVCVLHHVRPSDRALLVAEMARVTRSTGVVAVFEHNPRNPLTRWIVGRCAFDRDAILLGGRELTDLFRSAGLAELERRYILFGPWAGRLWGRIERSLSWLPMGTQFFVTGRPRPA